MPRTSSFEGALPRFVAAGITAAEIARARELATLLGTRPAARALSKELTEALDLRNRAFGHLEEAVDEVRAAGLFVFARDKAMASRFRSRYFVLRGRKARKRAAEKKNQPAPQPA